jgi:hypothetical protein
MMDLLPYLLFGLGGLLLLALLAILIVPRLRKPKAKAPPADHATRIVRIDAVHPGAGGTIVQSNEPQLNLGSNATIITPPAGFNSPGTSITPPAVEPSVVAPKGGVDPKAVTQVMPAATGAADAAAGAGAQQLAGDGTLMYARPMGVLAVTRGAQFQQTFQITGQPQVIGRKVGGSLAQIQLDSPFISRKHATLQNIGGVMHVIDHGSTSGTELNGSRLTQERPHPLRPGDTLVLADVHLTFNTGAGA